MGGFGENARHARKHAFGSGDSRPAVFHVPCSSGKLQTDMIRTVEELARELGGTLRGNGSAALTGVATLAEATANEVAFLDSPRFAAAAVASRAGCLLLPADSAITDRTAILL